MRQKMKEDEQNRTFSHDLVYTNCHDCPYFFQVSRWWWEGVATVLGGYDACAGISATKPESCLTLVVGGVPVMRRECPDDTTNAFIVCKTEWCPTIIVLQIGIQAPSNQNLDKVCPATPRNPMKSSPSILFSQIRIDSFILQHQLEQIMISCRCCAKKRCPPQLSCNIHVNFWLRQQDLCTFQATATCPVERRPAIP